MVTLRIRSQKLLVEIKVKSNLLGLPMFVLKAKPMK